MDQKKSSVVHDNVEYLRLNQKKASTLTLEIIEVSVMICLIFFIFWKFKNYFPSSKKHLTPED